MKLMQIFYSIWGKIRVNLFDTQTYKLNIIKWDTGYWYLIKEHCKNAKIINLGWNSFIPEFKLGNS